MDEKKSLTAFGPVPSRRLGRSLGINNIPPKICSYSCVYCQVGRTVKLQIQREAFYNPSDILKIAEQKIKKIIKAGESVDYITFVSDGEPTLEINLGKQIELLKQLCIKIAVISNASLIWRKDVQDDLSKADWVSLKIDAVNENIWRKINRPNKSLQISKIFKAIAEFSRNFDGKTATETMLVQDINDNIEEIKQIADFISGLKNVKSYISIPIRPPAEKWVPIATEQTINTAYQIFKEKNIDVEYLIGYEGNTFAFTGNIKNDLLSITSVHPMRQEAVDEFLKKAGADWNIIEKLIYDDELAEIIYKNNKFYMRKLHG
ncbi:radical SAM protein [bacterium]|nr:radical SAM protein [bacterium]